MVKTVRDRIWGQFSFRMEDRAEECHFRWIDQTTRGVVPVLMMMMADYNSVDHEKLEEAVDAYSTWHLDCSTDLVVLAPDNKRVKILLAGGPRTCYQGMLLYVQTEHGWEPTGHPSLQNPRRAETMFRTLKHTCAAKKIVSQNLGLEIGNRVFQFLLRMQANKWGFK